MENLFPYNTLEKTQFIGLSSGGSQKRKVKDPVSHVNKIIDKLNILKAKQDSIIASHASAKGTYLSFDIASGFGLKLTSFENRQKGIKLLSARKKNNESKEIEIVNVFIPKGQEHFFINKATEYLNSINDTELKNPKNVDLINSINNISLALVKSFIPNHQEEWLTDKKEWFEIWISNTNNNRSDISSFKQNVENLGLKLNDNYLKFPELAVFLVHANKCDLKNLLYCSSIINEIRKAVEPNSFYLDDLEKPDQIAWMKDFKNRILPNSNVDEDDEIVINILDTGIRNTHPLLNDYIVDEDMETYKPDWDKTDNVGHGTKMAGIALYDDLNKHLSHSDNVKVDHLLESSKILPDNAKNDPDLYGLIVQDLISKQIINHPNRIRINCMAVTSPEIGTLDGSPTSWSAAIDSITSGSLDEIQKLLFISAGNIPTTDWIGGEPSNPYTNINKISVVDNPGQSWNAITVGAYTLKADKGKLESPSMNIIAPEGGISPSSKTSLSWDRKWPIKPEIVFEGGNGVYDRYGCAEDTNLSSLTLNHDFIQANQFFSYINATSEATAHAAWMAAKILNKYPKLWPESVRGLMIHSAEWTEALKAQFLTGNTKTDYLNLLRSCGYGVPNLNKALESTENNINLIIEDTIQPFTYLNGLSSAKANEMHFHELPWPKEVLLAMGEKKVKVKVTLSYFIEPAPGEKGWNNRYRYASSALRFELNGTREQSDFLATINKAIKRDEEVPTYGSGPNWLIGTKNRHLGSVHSDTWEGTAAELAESNIIAIYPVSGWWKERYWLDKVKNILRYSLIISISTEENVDLYTPISNKIKQKININL